MLKIEFMRVETKIPFSLGEKYLCFILDLTRDLGRVGSGWVRNPEWQRRFFEDFGGGLLILDP